MQPQPQAQPLPPQPLPSAHSHSLCSALVAPGLSPCLSFALSPLILGPSPCLSFALSPLILMHAHAHDLMVSALVFNGLRDESLSLSPRSPRKLSRVGSPARTSFTPTYISLTVAHTEAGKNWRGLFRVDSLKEKVENPGLSDPRFNPSHRHSPCLLSPCLGRIALGLSPCLSFALSRIALLTVCEIRACRDECPALVAYPSTNEKYPVQERKTRLPLLSNL